MSGLLAFLYTPTSRDALERSIPALADRGSETRQALDAPGALLATTVFPWQEELNGGAVGRWNDVHVVADATLYYRPTLVRSLTNAGFPPRSTGAGDLIAAAVAAWDADAPRHLEGDFAYIAYRVTEHRGHAARDPVGTRPLFLTRRSDGLALASSPRALAASGVASTSLNLIYLAELCAGMVNAGAESAFADVQALRQGERIRFSRGGAPTIDAYWDPPAFTERGSTRTGFAEAAEELRALIVDAVRERLDPARPSYVSLSGGRDSTSVYAAASRINPAAVRSVSLSYPPGDIGREDETILEVVAMCGGEPHFLDTTSIPVLERLLQGSARRPDAFGHPYEATSRAIAETVAKSGSRVVLNGLGGDTLFHAELTYLSDLLFRGRWMALRDEWTSAGGALDPRLLFRWGVLPRLGYSARRLIGAMRGGRRITDPHDPPIPPWIAVNQFGDIAASRAWAEPARRIGRGGGGVADRDRRQLLLGSFAGRVVPEYFRISLSSGVEQRSPLYDLRIISFAATRPRSERRTGGDYKRLLRASMDGWLPQSVVGPRNRVTGFAGSYLRRSLARELPQVVASFGDEAKAFPFGLILAKEYLKEVDNLAKSGDHQLLPALVFTALTEHWLQQL